MTDMCMICFDKGAWLKPCPRCGKLRGADQVEKIMEKAGASPPPPETMLTDGSPVPKDHSHTAINPVSGQQQAYVVLTPAERAKGFVRPVRRSYVHVGRPTPVNPLRDLTPAEEMRFGGHGYVKYEAYPPGSHSLGRFWTQKMLDSVNKGCGAETRMSQDIAETYVRNLRFLVRRLCEPLRKSFSGR
jgi:hypothetical protein